MRNQKQDRRAPRVATSYEATLIDTEGSERLVVVTDLSKGGFRLLTSVPPAAGEVFSLRVDGYGVFPATILWVGDGEAGGSFLEPAPTLL